MSDVLDCQLSVSCRVNRRGAIKDLAIASAQLDWPLSSTSSYTLNADHFPFTHDHRIVEIVDCRADVARNQKQQITNCGYLSVVCNAHRQVLFTGRERLDRGMAKDRAGRDAGIGRYCLMSRITGNH